MKINRLSTLNYPSKLTSVGMLSLLFAQFITALADNALLFVTIALLKSLRAPIWFTPLLQELFVLSFVIFAPFVGPLTDAFPKARVMLYANLIKLCGVITILFGPHPLIGYALVGLGAASYSPAKFGILSELVDSSRLVKANSLIEGSTIAAILIGTVLGGIGADLSITASLYIILICYALAASATLAIPNLPPERLLNKLGAFFLIGAFLCGLKQLYTNHNARFSLLGTSLFWGITGTLRLLIVAWVPVALAISNNATPAILSAVVAVGVAIGAILAARFIAIGSINRILPAGFILGALTVLLPGVNNISIAVFVLILLGISGGIFIVPLNALLQYEGHKTIGTGNAVAAQNFSENTSIVLFLGIYTLAVGNAIDVVVLAYILGAILLIGISGLIYLRLQHTN